MKYIDIFTEFDTGMTIELEDVHRIYWNKNGIAEIVFKYVEKASAKDFAGPKKIYVTELTHAQWTMFLVSNNQSLSIKAYAVPIKYVNDFHRLYGENKNNLHEAIMQISKFEYDADL